MVDSACAGLGLMMNPALQMKIAANRTTLRFINPSRRNGSHPRKATTPGIRNASPDAPRVRTASQILEDVSMFLAERVAWDASTGNKTNALRDVEKGTGMTVWTK